MYRRPRAPACSIRRRSPLWCPAITGGGGTSPISSTGPSTARIGTLVGQIFSIFVSNGVDGGLLIGNGLPGQDGGNGGNATTVTGDGNGGDGGNGGPGGDDG